MFECKECSYDGSVFEFCESCRKKRRSLKPHRQYDEFYKDCTTELQIAPWMVSLGYSGIIPPALNEYTDFDVSVFKERSDIPMPEWAFDHINKLSKWSLLPEDKKDLISFLRNSDKALASFEFNDTFETHGEFKYHINKDSLSCFVRNWGQFPRDDIEDLLIDIFKCIKLKRIK